MEPLPGGRACRDHSAHAGDRASPRVVELVETTHRRTQNAYSTYPLPSNGRSRATKTANRYVELLRRGLDKLDHPGDSRGLDKLNHPGDSRGLDKLDHP